MTDRPDPLAAADAVVTDIDPTLSTPGVQSSDLVLVTGPWLAGTSSLIAELRRRLPEHRFVESDELPAGVAPAAVVFVVSANAPLTDSECALVDLASNYTDLVVGAVTKIDTHRTWREVLAADRVLLAERAERYREMPWAGVAAAPDLGEPRLDELVGLLRQRLEDPDLRRRNRLRAWESRLEAVIRRYHADGAGADREARVTALRARREEIRRERRLAKSERGIALRSQIQQARVQLAYFARNRCTSVRAELQEDVAELPRRRLAGLESHVRTRAGEVVAEVEEGITEHLAGVAAELEMTPPDTDGAQQASAPDVPPPPLKNRRQETVLMVLLGAGFGLGVALAVSRLFAGVAPGLTAAGLVAGGAVGVALTVWVVGIRGLLHDRAVLDRWIGEVTTTLRSAVEELVATRVLAGEAALTTQLTARDETEATAATEQIAAIDAELREHAVATARAAALRDRRSPPLQKALEAVRTELYGAGRAGTDDRPPPDRPAELF